MSADHTKIDEAAEYYENHDAAEEIAAADLTAHDPAETSPMVGYSVRLPKDVLAAARHLAEERGISTGAWLREAIEQAVAGRNQTGAVPIAALQHLIDHHTTNSSRQDDPIRRSDQHPPAESDNPYASSPLSEVVPALFHSAAMDAFENLQNFRSYWVQPTLFPGHADIQNALKRVAAELPVRLKFDDTAARPSESDIAVFVVQAKGEVPPPESSRGRATAGGGEKPKSGAGISAARSGLVRVKNAGAGRTTIRDSGKSATGRDADASQRSNRSIR